MASRPQHTSLPSSEVDPLTPLAACVAGAASERLLEPSEIRAERLTALRPTAASIASGNALLPENHDL